MEAITAEEEMGDGEGTEAMEEEEEGENDAIVVILCERCNDNLMCLFGVYIVRNRLGVYTVKCVLQIPIQ